jgi:hypothetical protein
LICPGAIAEFPGLVLKTTTRVQLMEEDSIANVTTLMIADFILKVYGFEPEQL